ncbi:MAG: hypothetical protein NVSMB52_01590 [Chloroflexota bacterium]
MNTIAPDRIFGHEVYDTKGNKIGTVDNVWVDDATNDLEFIGVKTGWFMGKTHIIPTQNADIADGKVTVPYAEQQVKDAPSFSADQELSPEEENGVYTHYGISRSTSESPSGLPQGGDNVNTGNYSSSNAPENTSNYSGNSNTSGFAATEGGEQAGVTLSEEQLKVETREVESGKVRLRKVTNTEHTEVPVELRREQVSIERVSATETSVPGNAFQDQEIEVPVMHQEPVVSKEAQVVGGVRLDKSVETETRTVGGDVRKEDVEIDDSTSRTGTSDRNNRGI